MISSNIKLYNQFKQGDIMKKKIIIACSVLLAALIAVFIIFRLYLVSEPLEKVLNTDFNKVDKVSICAGTTGKVVSLTDKKDIDGIY